MKQFRHFIYQYLTILLGISLLLITFNLIVDPYNIYNLFNFDKFNKKPLVTTHLRLAKAIAVQWKKPDFLFLGSSTAETGLNPRHPSLKTYNSYNLGLSGANIYEVLRYMQHAEAAHHVKEVYLIVNFFMFNAYSPNRQDFDENILLVNQFGKKNNLSINHIFNTLLSYDALKASLYTIKNQNQPNAFKEDGQLAWDYRKIQIEHLKGYKNNFIYTESFNKINLLPEPDRKFSFTNPKTKLDTLVDFKKILETGKKYNTKITIIFAPEHVRLLETYKLLGLWEEYENWQQQLVNIVQEQNTLFKTGTEVWAFNLINKLTTEKLPEQNDVKTDMHWFWDPQHFKNRFGNLILTTVTRPNKINQIENLAAQLNESNVKKFLLTNKNLLKKWEKVNPKEIQELKSNLANAH